MPIKPIDFATLPSKSNETSYLQKQNMDNAVNAEKQIGDNFAQKVNQDMHKTVQAKQKKDGNFKFDAKEKGQNEYQDNRKKKKSQKKVKPIYPKGNGGSFDISI